MSVPYIATRGVPDAQQLQRIAETVNALIAGKLDAVGSVTLTASSTTTVVTDNKFESNMVPVFVPTTANAAGALGGLYVSARTQGGFTLTHANTGTTDRTFLYVRLG
jgi:hypothetical protein